MMLQIPHDAPFTTEQQAWLAGFLAGVSAARAGAATGQNAAASMRVDVFVGSQTGTSELVADGLADALGGRGLGAQVASLADVTVASLAERGHVLIVTSTYGDGEMPDNAELFWEELAADSAPRLESLTYSVLALGDSAYDDFCQAGKLIDTRLEQLGATRLAPRVDCDVDYDEPADAWTADIVERLAAIAQVEAPADGGAPQDPDAPVLPTRTKPRWSRKEPYRSQLVANRLLSGGNSDKEIRHFELALGDSGIAYEAGDALAVVPRNDPELVAALLEVLDLDADELLDGQPLRDHLTDAWEIRAPSSALLDALAERHPVSELASVLARDERDTLDTWLWGRDVLDLVRLTPGCSLTPADLQRTLRPLQHRAYSISSSPLASPDRIHLTVAAVRHGADRERGGVASTFLSDRLGNSGDVGIFLQPNASFRVPKDDDAPIIMIGPGTGIAPFRAFLQEREQRGANGKNWLFFGDQHRDCDFIYEDEITQWQQRGLLDRVDLAFSRDQQEKVYVQTRMLAEAGDLYAWLEEGAHVYVCGDASRMAKDVDKALHAVIERHGGGADAAEYVANLKREKRYVRDVY